MTISNFWHWRAACGVFLAFVCLTASAIADDDEGFYASAGVGYMEMSGYCPGEGCKKGENYFSFGGGYQFNRYFSLEANGLQADGFKKTYATQTNGNDVNVIADADFRSYALAGRASLPLPFNDGFLFGKVGTHLWRFDSSGSGTVTAGGGSATQYYLENDIDGVDFYYGVGMQYVIKAQTSAIFGIEYNYLGATYKNNTGKVITAPKNVKTFGGSISFYF